MTTEIENIILENDYSELTNEQFNQLAEWASSEEEFITLKQILNSAQSLNDNIAPSPKLNSKLLETFKSTYPIVNTASHENRSENRYHRKMLFLWMKVGAGIAAILLILFMLYPLMKTADNTMLTAKEEMNNKETSRELKELKSQKKNGPDEIIHSENMNNTKQKSINQDILTPGRKNIKNESEELLRQETPLTQMDSNVEKINFAFSAQNARGSSVIPDHTRSQSSHSDRILASDLADRSIQIVQQRPEILDLLHTSF